MVSPTVGRVSGDRDALIFAPPQVDACSAMGTAHTFYARRGGSQPCRVPSAFGWKSGLPRILGGRFWPHARETGGWRTLTHGQALQDRPSDRPVLDRARFAPPLWSTDPDPGGQWSRPCLDRAGGHASSACRWRPFRSPMPASAEILQSSDTFSTWSTPSLSMSMTRSASSKPSRRLAPAAPRLLPAAAPLCRCVAHAVPKSLRRDADQRGGAGLWARWS